MDRLLLSVSGAAEATSLSRSFLYERIRSGDLKSIKIGAARRVHVDDLRQFVDTLREQAGQ